MPTFLVLLLAHTISQFDRSFLAVIASDIARDIGLDAGELGSMSAAWFGAFALAQFPVGFALDRIGPRWTLAGSTLAAVAGALLLAGATTYAECLLAMALMGIGCAPALVASMYVFARAYSRERFALMSSTIVGLSSVGNLAAATPLAFAVEALGWRGAMVAVAGLTLGSAVLAALLLRDPPPAASSSADRSILGGLGAVLRLRALWPILPLVAVSYAVVIATRSLWIAPFLGALYELDLVGRGHAALAMGLAMAFGAIAYGPIERLLGPKRTALAGSVVTSLGFVALGLWGNTSLAAAIALLTLVGAFGTTYAIVMAHARDFLPEALIGRGVTFVNFAFIGGAALIQWGSGLFVQASAATGLAPALTYGRLFLAFGLLLAAATCFYVLAPARAARADPQAGPA